MGECSTPPPLPTVLHSVVLATHSQRVSEKEIQKQFMSFKYYASFKSWAVLYVVRNFILSNVISSSNLILFNNGPTA